MFTCIATKPLNDGTDGFRFNFLGMKGMTRKRKPYRSTSSRGYNIQRGKCFNIYNIGRRTIYIEKAANKIITRRVRHFAGQEQMMDKTTKDKILAIINEHVKVPKDMEDRVCETLYKAYVEAKEELI